MVLCLKELGVNTLIFLYLDTVLIPIRLKFWGQPKVLGVNTSASKQLIGVRSDKC